MRRQRPHASPPARAAGHAPAHGTSGDDSCCTASSRARSRSCESHKLRAVRQPRASGGGGSSRLAPTARAAHAQHSLRVRHDAVDRGALQARRRLLRVSPASTRRQGLSGPRPRGQAKGRSVAHLSRCARDSASFVCASGARAASSCASASEAVFRSNPCLRAHAVSRTRARRARRARSPPRRLQRAKAAAGPATVHRRCSSGCWQPAREP